MNIDVTRSDSARRTSATVPSLVHERNRLVRTGECWRGRDAVPEWKRSSCLVETRFGIAVAARKRRCVPDDHGLGLGGKDARRDMER